MDRLDVLRSVRLERLVRHDLGADSPVAVEDDALDLVLGDDAQVLVGRLDVEKVVRDVAALAGVVVDPLGRADVSWARKTACDVSLRHSVARLEVLNVLLEWDAARLGRLDELHAGLGRLAVRDLRRQRGRSERRTLSGPSLPCSSSLP